MEALDDNAYLWNSSPCVLGTDYEKLRSKRPLRIGSHCTGWASEALALELENIPHQHVFACDSCSSVETLLKCSFDIGLFFKDANHESSIRLAPHVDFYACGFPCQPFSDMGMHGDFNDDRTLPITKMLRYLKTKLPTCFVLENVATLTHANHALSCSAILDELDALVDPMTNTRAYTVFVRILNTKHYRLAHSRPRCFIVGALARCCGHGNPDFEWPAIQPPSSIESVLDKNRDGSFVRGCGSVSDPSLLKSVPFRNLLSMQNDFDAIGKNPADFHVIVDIGASPSREQYCLGLCPAITKRRGSGQELFITSLNRMQCNTNIRIIPIYYVV